MQATPWFIRCARYIEIPCSTHLPRFCSPVAEVDSPAEVLALAEAFEEQRWPSVLTVLPTGNETSLQRFRSSMYDLVVVDYSRRGRG